MRGPAAPCSVDLFHRKALQQKAAGQNGRRRDCQNGMMCFELVNVWTLL